MLRFKFQQNLTLNVQFDFWINQIQVNWKDFLTREHPVSPVGDTKLPVNAFNDDLCDSDCFFLVAEMLVYSLIYTY